MCSSDLLNKQPKSRMATHLLLIYRKLSIGWALGILRRHISHVVRQLLVAGPVRLDHVVIRQSRLPHRCQEIHMFARSFRGLLLLCLGSFGSTLIGCSTPSGLDSIQISPASQGLSVGQTAQFTAIGTFGNASRTTTSPVTSEIGRAHV